MGNNINVPTKKVCIIFADAIDWRDCFLTTDKAEKWSKWTKACVVTKKYAKESGYKRTMSDLQWNLEHIEGNKYHIISESEKAFLTYDHEGNKGIVIKKYSNANMMTGPYYNTKDYLDTDRIWELRKANKYGDEQYYKLVTTNTVEEKDGDKKITKIIDLFLAIGTGSSKGTRDLVVNTKQGIEDKEKGEKEVTVKIVSGIRF